MSRLCLEADMQKKTEYNRTGGWRVKEYGSAVYQIKVLNTLIVWSSGSFHIRWNIYNVYTSPVVNSARGMLHPVWTLARRWCV